jgi:hypothetical protein
MKKLILAAMFSLYAQLSFAILPGIDGLPVTKQGDVGEAQVLMQKIAAIAPLSPLNDGQFEEFQLAVKKLVEVQRRTYVKKLGELHGQIYVQDFWDVLPQQAAVDPALAKLKGPLKQSAITVTYRTNSGTAPGRYFTDGNTNLFLSRIVELKGIVIHGECPDLFVCDQVYQFYVDSVKVSVFRGYQGGGYSSAGGG